MKRRQGFFDTRQFIDIFHRDTGQSMVEVVLTAPILVILIVVLVDSALIFQAYIGVISGANAGATYGSLSAAAASDTSGIRNQVVSESDMGHCASLDVKSTTSTDSYGYKRVDVRVTCTLSDLIAVSAVVKDVAISYMAVRRVRQ